MFTKDMKKVIVFAINKNITGLETKPGYNGAPILRISSEDYTTIKDIEQWAKGFGFLSNIIDKRQLDESKALRTTSGYDIFIIFGDDTNDSDIFELK